MNAVKKVDGLGGLPQGNIFDNIPDYKGHVDYETVPHKIENNKFSQSILDKNRDKYRGQAALMLTYLQKGNMVDVDSAKEMFGIRRLSGRIHDLSDGKKIGSEYGIYIDREWKLDKDGKQTELLGYFLPEFRDKLIKQKRILDRPRWWFSLKHTPQEIINEIKSHNNK